MKNKFLNNHNLRIFTILFLLLCLYVFVNAYFYVYQISNDLQKNVLRLHVVANSNSDEDQNLKYLVRDNLIEYMNSLCSNCTSKEETIEVVNSHLDDFECVANKTIEDNGFLYTASVELGNFEFPTKTYSDISFPSGYYDALKVNLGKSEGKNWWCVLYPSLCFTENSSGEVPDESKSLLEDNLSNEEYELISDTSSPTISFKFKLVEFFTQNHIITASK